MSYPNDAPATNMTGYWSDGSYTPSNTLAYIKDNFTPINKNAMVNSVGKNLSLIENFVNATYLGRSGTYIQNGYISTVHTGTLRSSGWADLSNIGSIYLDSNLEPTTNLGTSLGTGDLSRFNEIWTQTVFPVSISGMAAHLYLDASTDVVSKKDILPNIDLSGYNLGGPTDRWYITYASGFYGKDAQVNYITSPNYAGPTTPGTVYLCCNLIPEYNVEVFLGDELDTHRQLNTVMTKYITLRTTNTSWIAVNADANIHANNKETSLWVDSSGFVRRGNHKAFSEYLK